MRHNQTYRFPFAVFPAVRIMLLLMAGIIAARLFNPSLTITICLFAATGLFWVASEFIIRKKYLVAGSRIATFFYLMVICAAAGCLYQVHQATKNSLIKHAEPVNLFEWEEVSIRGTVFHTGISGSGRPVFEVTVHETLFEPDQAWHRPYRIRLYGDSDTVYPISTGSRIESEIRLYSFPERRNPHEFDYGGWLQNRGIAAHGELVRVRTAKKAGWISWGPLRAAIQKNTDNLFDRDYAVLAKALLLGYKDELTTETRQEFSRAGLSHIMAVSGLHVGFIVAPFWLIIPFLWGSKTGRWAGILLLAAVLLFYAGITGFSPSVSRASLMALLLTYGKLFHKVRNSVNLTAVAACIILLINPNQLFDVGFQLSFAAVFIILLLMPEAQQLIPARYRFGYIGGFISIILVSVVVQAGLFPILIHYFGEFSITGPVANALVVPVLSITVPLGLIFVVASPLSPLLFQAGAQPVQYTLRWIHNVAYSLGSRDFSYLTFDQTPLTLFPVWLFAIFLVASLRIPAIRWKMLIALLFSLNLLFIELAMQKPSHKSLEITFLDVGQADAVHIRTPNDKHLLIDAGRWSPMGNSGERVLLPYFEHLGIDQLDAVILTHPHADHIGGMPALLQNMDIKKIYQSDYEYDSVLYNTTVNLARQTGVPIYLPVAGDLIEIDDDIRLFVLGPKPNATRDRNPNNHSVVVKMVYGDTSFLFTGDAETAQETHIAAQYGDFLKTDLYKVGHHASNTSSTEVFMRYVEPEISVASLAFRNVFGHPGADAVSRLAQYSNRKKFTSLEGAIRFHSDGTSIKKMAW